MLPLTSKEYISYHNQTNCHICGEKFEEKYVLKINSRVKDHCHYKVYTEVLHMVCVIYSVIQLMKFVWIFTMDQIMLIHINKLVK